MKRMRYEKPVLHSLNDRQFASGRCRTGSNEVGDTNCVAGPSAGSNCKYGNVADTGLRCVDGGSNSNICKQGGAR